MQYQLANQIIAILKTGSYCYTQLIQQLNSPTAEVQAVLQGLQSLGLIERNTDKIQWLAPQAPLKRSAIEQACGRPLEIHYMDLIDSTNDYILEQRQAMTHGAICVAEGQLKGRGQRGRLWQGGFASDLCFSMKWQLANGIAGAGGLSLVIGIAIADCLREISPKEITVKWPNDIYCGGKKLGGILTELSKAEHAPDFAVIGIGINVKLTGVDQASISQPYCALMDVLPAHLCDRSVLLGKLAASLHQQIAYYEQHGLQPFVQRWQALDLFFDRVVSLQGPQQTISGIERGIDAQGRLLIEQANGDCLALLSGELSLCSAEDDTLVSD